MLHQKDASWLLLAVPGIWFVVILMATHIVYVEAAPTRILQERAVKREAPLASDIDGVHLLLLNDVDSKTPKNSFILLSKARTYSEGTSACEMMGDGGYVFVPGTSEASDLISLLKNNAPAQAEVSTNNQFWVRNIASGTSSDCFALNKTSGETDQIPCNTTLPTVCYNSVMRRVLFIEDKSRQIKVNTSAGQVQGWRDQNSFRFLGIPYAEPPVGDLRFAAPTAKAPFQNTWDATSYRSICPQTSTSEGAIPLIMSYFESGATENEDCLYLNVYTPSLKSAGEPLLPVMLYIHGGGFVSYSGSTIIFEPGNLVSRGGVVVVTINYRLGMLGWMEDEAWSRTSVPGNQALRDQILALQWVKNNIGSFGGDPSRVTVFGESAGAVSIRALLSTPSAFDLYQNVIGQSDPLDIPFKSTNESFQITNYFMQALNCTGNDLTCARSKSINEVLDAQLIAEAKALNDSIWTTSALVYRPSIDGDLIPADFAQLVKDGKYNTQANIMWGSTKDEAGLFVAEYFPEPVPAAKLNSSVESFFGPNRSALVLDSPYYQLNQTDPDGVRTLLTVLGTEYYFFCPLRYLSNNMTTAKPVFNFRFDRGRDTPFFNNDYCSASTGRVCHSADIQPSFASGDSVPLVQQTGDDARFARQVVDRFTTFAKSGNPNPLPGQIGVETSNPDVTGIQWPSFNTTNSVLRLDIQSTVSNESDNAGCTWMDTVLLYDFWVHRPNNTASE